jgi:ribosomal protein L16 Arg81 hydroxylase
MKGMVFMNRRNFSDIPDEKKEELLEIASKKLNKKPEEIMKVLNSGSLDSILKNLKTQDIEKLQNLLADEEATEKLLSSPQAQMLIKNLFKE